MAPKKLAKKDLWMIIPFAAFGLSIYALWWYYGRISDRGYLGGDFPALLIHSLLTVWSLVIIGLWIFSYFHKSRLKSFQAKFRTRDLDSRDAWRLLFARMIDVFVLIALMIAILSLGMLLLRPLVLSYDLHRDLTNIFSACLLVLLFCILQFVTTFWFQRTIGMKALGLVFERNEDGAQPRMGDIVIRMAVWPLEIPINVLFLIVFRISAFVELGHFGALAGGLDVVLRSE
jgi:hypothetical protein